MSDEKSSQERANEDGQRDGSTGGQYGYMGYAYSSEDRDAYNAGYNNGVDNPAPSGDSKK